jgi:hypothetical protein
MRLAAIALVIACGGAPRAPDPEQRDQPVTEQDLAILDRATAKLADPAHWNRHDDRNCPAGATSWSLFCALHDASIEVLGHYEHRRVALQEVRFVIEEVTRGQPFEHRLMDYNNLPSTTIDDVRHVIEAARQRVARRLAAR